MDVGSCFHSRSSVYQVQSFLGQGRYGEVAACKRMGDNMKVAIKVMRRVGNFDRRARHEVSSMGKLRELDPEKSNIVRFYHSFVDREHFCLVYEQLDLSLNDFMRSRNPRQLQLKEIRPIVQQVANALDHLRTVGMIHGDLKLDNVMLVNHRAEPYRVKLIDFGLSRPSPGVFGSDIQSLPYRSPEIILGLPFTEAVDMWSLGCMAAAMYLGVLLYPGRCDYDMMKYIVETQGLPPDHLLNLGGKSNHYFYKIYDPKASYWELKTPKEFQSEAGTVQMAPRTNRLQVLDDLRSIRAINAENGADRAAQGADVFMFVSMVKEMLQIDAARRIPPRQVMRHDFISMDHMAGQHSQSSHVKSSFDLMGVCQKNLGPDSVRGGHRPFQQPTSLTSHPATQTASPPPPPTPPSPPPPVDRDLSRAHSKMEHPCTPNLDSSAVESGMKRKRDNEVGTVDDTCCSSKWFKRPLPPPPVDRGLSRAHSKTRHPCTPNLDSSAVESGMKRKRDNVDRTMDESSHPSKRSQRQSEEYSGLPSYRRCHHRIVYPGLHRCEGIENGKEEEAMLVNPPHSGGIVCLTQGLDDGSR